MSRVFLSVGSHMVNFEPFSRGLCYTEVSIQDTKHIDKFSYLSDFIFSIDSF